MTETDAIETLNANNSELKADAVNDSNKVGSNKLDESKLRYENGKCFYKDPKTGCELTWNDETQAWIPTDEYQTRNYMYEEGTYSYYDKSAGTKYIWDVAANKWVKSNKSDKKGSVEEEEEENDDDDDDEEEENDGTIKKNKFVRQDMSAGIYGFEGDTHTYTDPNDGTVYAWDLERHAWFPKIDDDFLAKYQMSYGVNTSENTVEEKPEVKETKTANPPENVDSALKRKLQEPTWFDVNDENNTKVYVTNLPTDITEQEFVDLMQKCGLVMKDVENGKMKIKLYTEPGTDILKGDALCTYIKVESVELALNLLDGYDFKGKKIHVERAKFTMKGSAYDPTLKPKKKRRKDKEKIKKMQEKLFDWRPEKMRGERAKHEKIVIVKNLFDPSIFNEEVGLILEYQQDLREECMKCGDVRKITIFDRHPEGVAQINFKEHEAADACVQLLNGRWFGQRQITAETWDGRTKFKIAETEAEINNRIKKWDNFLDTGEEIDKGKIEGDKEQNKPEENVSEMRQVDSDNETRSSAGSGDETE